LRGKSTSEQINQLFVSLIYQRYIIRQLSASRLHFNILYIRIEYIFYLYLFLIELGM